MRYSTTLASVALVAGAAAKPQARREKSCPAPSAPVHVPGEGSVVPVPVPVESSTSVGAESVSSAAPYPVPSGYANNTVPGPSFSSFISIIVPTSASAIATSSIAASSIAASSIASSAIAASSAVSEPVLTSSAPASESSAPGSTVPVGQVIFECTEPNTFALTYDDGPFTYTNGILDLLAETDIKATFFVNGNNFGNINNFQDVIRRMVADGHQIGSHTYAHPDLATLGDAGVINAMVELEDALDAIIGEIPTYMRPPFFSYNDQTLRVLGELGYHVIQADIDTFDYQFATIGDLTGATNLQNGINAGGNLALAHDVHQNTGEVLTPEFIRIIQASGLRGVTVGECLGDPASNWYRARRSSTPTATSGPSSTVSITSTSTPTGAVDPNGSCGGSTGFVCGPGACCSEHGFCGSSIAYCGAGCQPDFGVCGVNVPANPGGEDGGSPAPAPGGVSPDNTCGGDNAYTCPDSTCCSQYGFCGDTTDHCGAGCQNAFGVCT